MIAFSASFRNIVPGSEKINIASFSGRGNADIPGEGRGSISTKKSIFFIVHDPSGSPIPATEAQGDFGILHMASQILNENAAQEKNGEAVKPVMDTSIELKQPGADYNVIENAERPVIQGCEDKGNCQILVGNGRRKNEKDSGVEAKTLQNILLPQEKTGRNDPQQEKKKRRNESFHFLGE